jgi:hypothetical protein
MNSQTPARLHDTDQREILARQGLRLPAITLKHLRSAGIYCQPTVSIEHQHLARMYVLRGVESGGAVADLGAYSSFVAEGRQWAALAATRGHHRGQQRACHRGRSGSGASGDDPD